MTFFSISHCLFHLFLAQTQTAGKTNTPPLSHHFARLLKEFDLFRTGLDENWEKGWRMAFQSPAEQRPKP